nr:ankyrin repeat protein family-like [Oryza sativa Japonica Group]
MASPAAETSPPSTPSLPHCLLPHPAAGGGERQFVKALLADPAAPDLNAVTTGGVGGGNTLLHMAAPGGHAPLVCLLHREHGLDTRLHLTARVGAQKVIAASSSSVAVAASPPPLPPHPGHQQVGMSASIGQSASATTTRTRRTSPVTSTAPPAAFAIAPIADKHPKPLTICHRSGGIFVIFYAISD